MRAAVVALRIEQAWFEALRRTRLYRALAVDVIDDLPAALAGQDVLLRQTASLTPLRRLWSTSRHASGIRLRNARGWAAQRARQAPQELKSAVEPHLCHGFSGRVPIDPEEVMEAMNATEQTRSFDRRDEQGWWPADLGDPSSAGSQDNVRYAFFADARRLVVEREGVVAHYDTADHWVTGVSQSAGVNEDLAFNTPDGTLDLKALRPTSGDEMTA